MKHNVSKTLNVSKVFGLRERSSMSVHDSYRGSVTSWAVTSIRSDINKSKVTGMFLLDWDNGHSDDALGNKHMSTGVRNSSDMYTQCIQKCHE